ncbi:MAG TPA: hypothetical protein VKB46_19290, partial [Pyrinomonadaceae bacterium]|nr:hypothetical protein [Pyrinomonadaceae bacterium]
MRKKYVAFCMVLLGLMGGSLWSITSYSQKSVVAGLTVRDDEGSGTELVAGYRQWTRVNPVPVVQASRISLQCAAPTTQQRQLESVNPHANKFITVYVNDIGRHAMMNEKLPRFPLGSVIV